MKLSGGRILLAERTARETARGTSVRVDLRKAAGRPALCKEQSEEKSYLILTMQMGSSQYLCYRLYGDYMCLAHRKCHINARFY